MKIIMTRGLPASGKTFWANTLLKSEPGKYKNICKDDLRAMLDDSKWTNGNEKFVLRMRDSMIEEALETGFNVISSDTNFHPKHEARLRQLAEKHKAEFEIKDFDTDVHECIARDAKRANGVGKDVIWDMWKQFVIPKVTWHEDRESCAKCVIVDLDGTIADMGSRNPYDASTCEQDKLNKDVVAAIKGLGIPFLIFVSGRSDKYFEQTNRWLLGQEELDAGGCLLLMRKDGDNRKDWLVKFEILRDKIIPAFNPIAVFDDRDQVVAMWRAQGLRCFQVADGNF